MIDTDEPTVAIVLSAELPPGDRDQLVAAVEGLGLPVRVGLLPARRGTQDWLALLTTPLTPVLAALAGAAGADAYAALRTAITDLLRRARGDDTDGDAAPPPTIALQDAHTGLRVVLDAQLTDEGYDQLLTLDLRQFRNGPVRYDPTARRWRSDLDDAEDARTRA